MSFPTHRLGNLAGHGGAVNCITFSSGIGQYILSGCTDRLVRLYNATTQKLVQSYSGHGYGVLDVCVSASNSRFASVGGDRVVYLWDVPSGKNTRRFSGHEARVNCCCFGAAGSGIGEEGKDEEVLITGSHDATVRLWDLKSSNVKPIQVLTDAKDSITSVVAIDHQIITGSVDGRLRTYDIRMGNLYTDAIGYPITCLAPSLVPSTASTLVLVSTQNGPCHLFDRTSGKSLKSYTSPQYENGEYRLRAALGFADRYVISGSEDGSIFVWDSASGTLVKRVEGAHGGKVVSAVAVRTGVAGRRVETGVWCSAGVDGNAVIWGHAPDTSR